MVNIKGFNHYKVDREGNVYSFKGGRAGIKLKPQARAHQQTVVYMYDIGGNRHRRAVSHIVAEAFLDNPHNLPNVVHKNSDRADNRLENLVWANTKDTHTIVRNNGVYKQYKVDKHTQEIKDLYAGGKGMKINAIAKKFNVNRATIRWHLLGRRYSARQPAKELK